MPPRWLLGRHALPEGAGTQEISKRHDDGMSVSADACPRNQDSHAQAFWGLARRNLEKAGIGDPELAADIAVEVSRIVQNRRKVGWQNDRDVENLIRNDIDDFFFEELRGRRDLSIDPAILDAVVDDVLASARVRLAQ
jgi:type I restriction enzyme, R subunit